MIFNKISNSFVFKILKHIKHGHLKLTNFNNDVFFAMSHGVHRGILKKGKFDKREIFIKTIINKEL